MVFGTPCQLLLAESIGTVTVADTCLTVSSQLKSLGVIFDPDLLLRGTSHHCARRVITTYGHCDIFADCCRRTLTRRSLLVSSVPGLTIAMVFSMEHRTPELDNLQKLQKVQNCLARIVLQQRKSCHAQPLLKSLHWLPITQRINFKLATLAFKIHFST